MDRAWQVDWIDPNVYPPSLRKSYVLYDEATGVAQWPSWQRKVEHGGQIVDRGFWLTAPDAPPPTLRVWVLEDWNWGIHSSLSEPLTRTHSALVEVPEPAQSHLYAAALLTVAFLHRWRRKKRGV